MRPPVGARVAAHGPVPSTLVAVAVCLIIYSLVLVLQPEVTELLGVDLGGRTRARTMTRVVLSFAMVWGFFVRARWAWWSATVFTIAGSVTGILGVIFVGRFGQVHLLVDTLVAPFGIIALMTAATLLLLPQTRAAFGLRARSDLTDEPYL